MIDIKNVSKWYGSFQVLTDCTTSIQKGDIVVDGISIADPKTNLPKLRSRVGMVFQHFELFPHLTITQNLTLGQTKVLGRKEDEAVTRGLKLLDRVGLIAQKDKFPGQLSGGQQQYEPGCNTQYHQNNSGEADHSSLLALRRCGRRTRSSIDSRDDGAINAAIFSTGTTARAPSAACRRNRPSSRPRQ